MDTVLVGAFVAPPYPVAPFKGLGIPYRKVRLPPPPLLPGLKVRYLCGTCLNRFTRRSNMRAHVLSVHIRCGRRIKCPSCPSTFTLESNRRRHIRLKHSDKQ